MAPSVVAKALRGGSYLFLQRVLTFALNSFVLRKLQLSVTGAVTVRLELALASVFFLRDGFRLAFLRMPSLDMDDNDQPQATTTTNTCPAKATSTVSEGYVQQLVNVAWLSTALSWLVALAIILVGSSAASASSESKDDGLQDYGLVLTMYCIAAMVEALAEPMYVLAHCSVLVSWQVSAQSAGFLVRALVQYACIFVFDLGLLAYGCAEIAYASTLFLVFAGFFWRRIYSKQDTVKRFALTSILDLLPRSPSSLSRDADGDKLVNKRWFHPQLLALLVPLSLQSGVKYLLTEGDKWVLSLFASFQNMGVYGIVFHLGSLVPRIVFLPIEEATKTIFSKMATSSPTAQNGSKPKTQDGFHLVLMLLKLMNLIGLVFICFGVNYAHTLVLLLYGVEKARLGVAESLTVYCVYIHFLGLNGICEAFVHAVGSPAQLMRLNKLMAGFFVLYAASAALFMSVLALGTPGIILANCVNMGCRILYCLSFMAAYFASSTSHQQVPVPGAQAKKPSLFAFWRQSLPDRVVLVVFLASFAITAVSKRLLLAGAGHSESLVRHAAHVAIGGVCFAAVGLALYVRERHVIREQLALLRQRRHQEQQPSGQQKPHDE